MKRMILAVAILILIWATFFFALKANAAPFVVCDPYPTAVTQPTYFELTLDAGAAFQSPAMVQSDNSVILHYDVGGVTTGNHNLTVKACDMWGCSSTVPFAFGKSVPSASTGIRLSNN